MNKVIKAQGRPPKFNQSRNAIKRILEALATGESIRKAIAKENLSWNTFRKWMNEKPALREQYEQANPTAVKWGEVAGMLTTGGALSLPFKYFDKLPRLQRFLAKTGFFGATGATYGGLKAKEGEAAEKTVTGGVIGTYLHVIGLKANAWHVSGVMIASGNLATSAS